MVDATETRRREVLAFAEQLTLARRKLAAALGDTVAGSAEARRAKATREYQMAAAAYDSAVDALLSERFRAGVDALRRGDASGVDEALAFLEVDPWFFRSGYTKQNLMRYLRHVPLTERQKERIRSVILELVQSRPRLEFREYCRTAKSVDSPTFRTRLMAIGDDTNGDARTRQQAAWLLAELERNAEARGDD